VTSLLTKPGSSLMFCSYVGLQT